MLSLGTSSPVQLACIAKVPVQRAFLHSGYAQIGERERVKCSTKQGVVGRAREHLPANPSILKNPFTHKKGS